MTDHLDGERDVFVIVQECAIGNGQVGDMWLETAVFPSDATLEDVWKWRAKFKGANGGRLMITEPTNP